MFRHNIIGGGEAVKNSLQYMELSVNSLASSDRKVLHAQRNLAMTYLEKPRLAGIIEHLEKAEELLNMALGAIPSTDP
jgi:hypothetical protein